MIATDHAPHSAQEKSRGLEKSAMGIVGLETAFAELYTNLVRRGELTLERLVELLCVSPGRRFGIGTSLAVGAPADLAAFELETPYQINPDDFLSLGKSTPFAGDTVYGRCRMTMVNGRIVWQENLTEKIVLEDGAEYPGVGFGYRCDRVCEIVFNTSMVGYQEIVSDPSNTYQMVVMTYPLIGNYGIADDDFETKTPTLGGLVVRE